MGKIEQQNQKEKERIESVLVLLKKQFPLSVKQVYIFINFLLLTSLFKHTYKYMIICISLRINCSDLLISLTFHLDDLIFTTYICLFVYVYVYVCETKFEISEVR